MRKRVEFVIEKIARMAFLLDFYGGLLTEKQQCCLDMHYNQDMSLAEIAEIFLVSRQAIHDILKRSENLLEEYEARLGLVKRFMRNRDDMSQVIERLKVVAGHMASCQQLSLQAEVDDIRVLIEKIIDQQ